MPSRKLSLFVAGILLMLLQGGLFFSRQSQLQAAAASLRAEHRGGELGLDASDFTVLSVPSGATLSTQDGREIGLTPCRATGVEALRSFTLRAAGYEDSRVNKEKLANPVLLIPGWPLWLWLHLPGMLGLALLTLAMRRQAVKQEQDARQETTSIIAVRFVGPGARMGPYLLEEKLGQGAMSEVFAAANPHPPPVLVEGGDCVSPPRAPPCVRVAVKVLTQEVCQHEQTRERFTREAQICQKLVHPGIVSALAVGQHQGSGRLWMAQQLIDGESLDHRPLPLAWPDVVALLIPLGEALAYAHEAGIVHRDLKPANILLSRDGRPFISDFGLAYGTHYETITKTDMTLGTPAYMPPEQLSEKRVDGRADLYSLGCIAFELLVGRVPFVQADIAQLLMAHYSQPAERVDTLVADLPPALVELVARLLEKDPAERPACAQALVAELRAL